MPLYGDLDLTTVEQRLPRMQDLDTEAWELPRAEILQLALEVNDASTTLLPKAMHPAIPPYVQIRIMRYPESPVGPFNLAQVRLVGRAGAHPRGLVLGAVASTPEAADVLGARWGFPAIVGAVTLRRYHDRVAAQVGADGAPILHCALVNPEPISGGDVQYIHAVTLAACPTPRLVQVDSHYTFHKAERGRPVVDHFDPAAWNADPIRLAHPIAATFTTCDTDLPRIRFVMDPEIPVVRGTTRIR
jgi:hypothetical protein